MRRLTVFDTTLRDGDQAAGFAFDKKIKPKLAVTLAGLGVDIVEAGFPLSSSADFEACRNVVSALKGSNAQVALMCRCRTEEIRKTAEILCENNNGNGIIHLTLPVSDVHISSLMNISRSELIEKATEAVAFAAGQVPFVEVGAEDATRADFDFLCEYCDAVCAAGANIVNIADTLGLFSPTQTKDLVKLLRKHISCSLSIHCHNDLGLAVANTLAAIEAGCDQFEATICGIGERAGNAALEEIAVNLSVHPEFSDISTNLHLERMSETIRRFCIANNFSPGPMKPIIGWNVRAHASGIHQKGLSCSSDNYSPEAVQDCCPPERVVLSRHSGKAGVRLAAEKLGLSELNEAAVHAALNRIKNSESRQIGVTEFLKILDIPIFSDPIYCLEFSERHSDQNVFVTATLSNNRIASGEGPDAATAVLAVTESLTGLRLELEKTESTALEGQYRFYAEIMVLKNNQQNIRIAAERQGTHPARLLFECCLDAVNAAAAQN